MAEDHTDQGLAYTDDSAFVYTQISNPDDTTTTGWDQGTWDTTTWDET